VETNGKRVKSMKLDPEIIKFREQIMKAENLKDENELEEFFIEAVLKLKQLGHEYRKSQEQERKELYERLTSYYRINGSKTIV
jgi:hypothetical protein